MNTWLGNCCVPFPLCFLGLFYGIFKCTKQYFLVSKFSLIEALVSRARSEEEVTCVPHNLSPLCHIMCPQHLPCKSSRTPCTERVIQLSDLAED